MAEPFDLSSRYYDLLYADKDYVGEATYVKSLLSRHGVDPPAAVLELGCGTGAHAEILAHAGFEIIGVDHNAEMLARATRRFESAGMAGLACRAGDARTFRAGRSFDAVVSLFHVASYQTSDDDVQQYFETASAHLPSGGIFVFDVWYGPAVLTQLPSTRVKRVADDQAEIVRLAEPTLLERQNRVDIAYQIFVTDRDTGAIYRFDEKHEMRYFFENEIRRFAADAGMKIVDQERWMSDDMPSRESWGVVFIAVKT